MVTADPARTPTFTPFAEGDYFLNASSTTPCDNSTNAPPNACVFLPNTTPPANTFAWNHGGIQPEVATTWVGIAGPGVKNLGQDHTVRPRITPTSGPRCSRCSAFTIYMYRMVA